MLLQQLPHWAPCSVTQALEFLTPPYKGHPRVMAYVLRVLETYPPETVTFFMPQLVQSLRYDEQVRILSVICMFLSSMMIREISVYIFFFIIAYRRLLWTHSLGRNINTRRSKRRPQLISKSLFSFLLVWLFCQGCFS